jgi:APA family basic amino acid/polyamine antiporter
MLAESQCLLARAPQSLTYPQLLGVSERYRPGARISPARHSAPLVRRARPPVQLPGRGGRRGRRGTGPEPGAHDPAGATVLGVLICAGVYLIGLLGVQGSVPQATLMTSSAPFAAAAQAIAGAHWPAHVIEVVACISALGARNGWTMVNGEMADAAARDRLFPDAVARRDARGIPVLAIFINTVLATLLLIANAAGNVVDLFTTLALLSTFVYVLTYVLAVAAFLMRTIRGQTTQTGRPLAFETLAAGLALAFSIWMIGATGKHTEFDGVLLVLIGIPVYLADQWRRARAGTAEPAPADPPPAAPSAAAQEGG